MKSIPSGELFGNASLSPPVAPKHTREGHEQCAYYAQNGVDAGESVLACFHGEQAVAGAFYSEDHVKKATELAQKFLQEVETLLRGHPNPSILLPHINEYREYFK